MKKIEVVLQCKACMNVLCKPSILERKVRVIAVENVSMIRLESKYGECVVLCAFCDVDLGEVKSEVINLLVSACNFVEIRSRKANIDLP